ncbi:MAG: D-alanyl-D-alanine carboxypeptidase family protein [Parachlamydiales bacterium]
MLRSFLVVFFCFWVLILDSKLLNVDVRARSALLMNSENGRVLFEKNAFLPLYPASTTKIATALYALDVKGDLIDQKICVSIEALRTIDSLKKSGHEKEFPAYFLETDGTVLGLSEGEEISVQDLLYATMLVSGNDAANALAQALGGSIPGYMEQVNGHLKSLGCQRTLFLNPHGLHHPGHVTCAMDLALMTKRALLVPKFCEIVATVSYQIPETNKHALYQLRQLNRLMKAGAFYYPWAIGVKTGYHSNAGYNLVAAAEKNGRRLIAVVLGEEKNESRYLDARHLFEAAFSEPKIKRKLFEKGQVFETRIDGGAAPLLAGVSEELEVGFYPSEERALKALIYWDELRLPILKDEKVGVLKVLTDDGEIMAEKLLLAQAEVPRTFWHFLKQWLFLAKKKEPSRPAFAA